MAGPGTARARVLAAFVLLAVMLGSTALIAGQVLLGDRRPPAVGVELPEVEGEPLNFTLLVAPGDSVYYEFKQRILHPQVFLPPQENVLRLEITGFDWPDVVMVHEFNGTLTPSRMPYGHLAAPLELLGGPELGVPVMVPLASTTALICVELTLRGEESLEVGGGEVEAYVYEGSVESGAGRVEVEAWYSKSTGLLLLMRSRAVMAFNETAFFEQRALNYTLRGEEYRVTTPPGWLCEDGFSSELLFVADGILALTGGEARRVDLEELVEATKGEAVLAVLSKSQRSCPGCDRLWTQILMASRNVEVPIYVAVQGGMIGEREWKFSNTEAFKAGASQLPVIIAYKGGSIQDRLLGIQGWRDIVEWINEIYG